MRRNPGALRPLLLSTVLTISATRDSAFTARSLLLLIVSYSALTAGIYVLACIVADPERSLIDLWNERSLWPVLVGAMLASLISPELWPSHMSIFLLFLDGLGYVTLTVLWISIVRAIARRIL
jgi:hypothetical protein